MRIIAGEWGGRTIEAPKGRVVRPTSDRAREAWMSIVHPLLPGARVLDAPYGRLPDLSAVDPPHDVVFAWNGTAAGVRVPYS